jgi:zinc transport system ATP-binding protein
MALITCDKLSLGYEGKAILEDLNFSIESGDYFCIVGENGSGKTTLMRTLLGLIKPMGGSITFGEGLKSSQIGYLPQQTTLQKEFPASVREIVLSGCRSEKRIHPFYSKEQKNTAQEAMDKMQISHLARKSYRELSGGQQQRVLLARALCAASKVLLLDEPVSGLDPKVTAEMYEVIEQLNQNEKITIIMISHDLGEAIHYANRILHIGSSVFCGSVEDYLQSKEGRYFANHICSLPEGTHFLRKPEGRKGAGHDGHH